MEARQEVHSIDAVLVSDMADRANGVVPKPEPIVEEKPAELPETSLADEYGAEKITDVPRETIEEAKEDKSEVEQKATDVPRETISKPDSAIDEYGNPVEKPKMYSEEDVQRLIRDRLARVKNPEVNQPTQHQVQQAAEGFQHDPNSEQSWEDQLNQFVDKRIETREKMVMERQWKAQEDARQMEFQTKFTSGMNKYQDFHKVVEGQPITDSMMMATRSLDNPAAFVYAAAKMHPQELGRISQISDPYTQASEIGRLHERMVKERRMVSAAAKPIEPPKADMPAKTLNMPSLESRIDAYAKQKRK